MFTRFILPILIILLSSNTFAQVFIGNEASQRITNAEKIWLDKEKSSVKYVAFNKNEKIKEEEHSEWLKKILSTPNHFSFKLKRKSNDNLGQTHYRYDQYINNYLVHGTQYIIHKKGNQVLSANGEYLISNQISSQINIDKIKAESIANKSILSNLFADKKDLDLTKLVYFHNNNELILSYKVDVYSLKPLSRNFVYVNASNGKIIGKENRIHEASVDGTAHCKYHGTQTIKTDSISSFQYILVDSTRKIFTLDMNTGTNYSAAVYFQDADNIWNTTANQDDAALDAHWGTENCFDYFLNNFGLNSFDGNGSNILNYVHFDTNYVNAFWNGSNLSFGDGDGVNYSALTNLDIVAHEYTHAVTTSSANLVYQDEPGALNESFSDIFGATIDFLYNPSQANWLMGDISNLNNSFFRSMENPNIKNDPDTYLGNYWYTDTFDYGGVHTNSGVQNYWFYLLSNGGSGVNDNGDYYDIDGIGIQEAAQIAYRNLSFYLTPNSQYNDAQFFAIQSANDLFGSCSQQAISTKNAWHAVGIGSISEHSSLSSFSEDKTSVCNLGTNISFTNESLNDTARIWQFGDGNTDTTNNPIHFYTSTGVYDVTLISFGNSICGTYTDTLVLPNHITVTNGGPISASCTYTNHSISSGAGITNFTFDSISNPTFSSLDGYVDYSCTHSTTVTEGDIVNLSVSVNYNSDYYKVYIDFNNDGAFDNLTEVIYDIYNVQGTTSATYQIPESPVTNTPLRMRIKAHNSNFTSTCVGNQSYTRIEDYAITILDLNTIPNTDFYAGDTVTGVESIVDFTNIPNSFQTSFIWSFPGGIPSSSTQENPSIEYQIPGEYDVQLISSNTFGSDTLLKTNYIEVLNQIRMCNTINSSSLDTGILFDSGGPLANYSTNEDCYFLIEPECADSIFLNFILFNTESGYDRLRIYDGTSTSGPLLGTFQGNSIPQGVVATSGAMYLYFHSDGSSNRSGFMLEWETTKYIPSPTIANFSISEVSPPVGAPVYFSDLSTNLPSDWYWNFGDGDTSLLQNPSHSFSSPGTYNIQLMSSTCFQSDSIMQTINVQGYPNINFNPTSISETINSCSDSTIVPITIFNTGIGDLYLENITNSISSDSLESSIIYNSTGANTTHTFNLSPNLDSLFVTINLDGDFNSSSEYATLFIDGINMGIVPDNFSNQATYSFILFGAQLNSFLTDGEINILLDNSTSVNVGSSYLNMHQVIIEYEASSDFMSFEIDTSIVSPGDSTLIYLSLNTSNLQNGTYIDSVLVISNDSASNNAFIPVTMINNGSAEISFSDTCVAFNNTRIGESDTSGIWIYNNGCDTLNIFNISSSENEITYNSSVNYIAPFDSSFITLSFAPDTIEILYGTLSILSNLGISNICLLAEGLAIPIISYSNTVFNDTILLCEDSITLPLTIYNNGLAGLDFNLDYTYDANNSIDWIQLDTSLLYTNINDSLNLDITIHSNDLVSGNYNAILFISSNDPFALIDTIPISLTIIGAPKMQLNYNCIMFDTIIEQSITSSSLKIENLACSLLSIDSFYITNPLFKVDTNNINVLPYDSSSILINFAPLSSGTQTGLLEIYSNDIDTTICLEAFVPDPPILYSSSDSIIETIIGCNDTIVIPITIYNQGVSTLISEIETYGDSNTQLYLYEDFELNNSTPDNSILGNNCLELIGSNSLTFNIPQSQPDYFSVKLRSDGTSTSGTNYVSVGVAPTNANVVFIGWNGYNNTYSIYAGNSNTKTYYVPNNQEWTLFELKNIDFNTFKYDVYANGVKIMNQASFRSTSFNYLSTVRLYGGGSVSYYDDLYIGRDFPNWATTEIDSLHTLNNDSSIVNLFLYSNNLFTGTYYSNVVIESNDPYNTYDTIPIVFTVTGDPELTFGTSCLTFDSTQQYNTSNSGIWLFNTGCDSLIVNQISSSNNDIHFEDSSIIIQANDSFYFESSFNPYGLGQYNETITFNTNVGNIDLCVSGNSFNSLNHSPTIIIDTILSCNDSIQIPLTLYNTNNSFINVQLNTHGDLIEESFFFFDGFESGTYNNWSVYGNPTKLKIDSSGGASGNYSLELSGNYTSISDGLLYQFPSEQIDYISVKLKTTVNSFYDRNNVHIGTSGNMDAMTEIYVDNQTYYIRNGSGVVAFTPSNISIWTKFELKNIDYNSHTFDVYINDNLFMNNLSFYNSSISGITRIRLGNDYAPVPSYFDDIQIGKKSLTDNLTLNSFDINIPAGDTFSTNINLYSYGLPNGTHTGSVTLNSSDITEPYSTIPVSLTVIGQASLTFGDSCVAFDPTLQYSTDTFTTLLYNIGCDTLTINNISTLNSDITFSATTIQIAPYDSFELNCLFTPTSYNSLSGNINFSTNVGNSVLCVEGITLPVPEMSFNPTEIIDTIFSCNDSLIIPINIYNTGNDTLKTTFQLGYENDFDYVFFDGFEFDSLSNLDFMYPTSSIFDFFEISQENPANGDKCLKIKKYTYNSPRTIMNLNPVPVDYISFKTRSKNDNGAYSNYTIEVDGYFEFQRQNINQINLQGGLIYTMPNSEDWIHFEMKNIDYSSHTFDLYIDNVLIQNNRSFNVFTNNLSTFEIIINGGYTNDAAQFFDDIQFGNQNTQNWTLENSFSSNHIVPNDSGIYNLTIRNGDYVNDTYLDYIIFSSNDPLSLLDTIPVSITVLGSPEISFNDSCVVFDTVMQNNPINYDLVINNPGCDTLYIDSVFSLDNTITFDTLSLSIEPFSFEILTINSLPVLAGDYSGILNFNTNIGDTSICFSGFSLGSPFISHSPLEIIETINSCNDSITIPITVYNDGLGELNTDIHLLNFSSENNFNYFNGLEEIGNLTGWNLAPNTATVVNNPLGGAPATGDSCLLLDDNGNVSYTFSPSQIDYVSVKLRHYFFSGNTNSTRNHFIVDGICSIYAYDYFPTRYRVSSDYPSNHYNTSGFNNQWVKFELKNIDYTYKTYALYVNDVYKETLPFSDTTVNSVSSITMFNGYYYTGLSYYDDIQIGQPLPNWIKTSQDTTNTAIGDSTTFYVTLSSEDLDSDIYHSNLVFTSNDPLSPFDTIPITLNVNGDAKLALSTSCISFDTLIQNTSKGNGMHIYNNGCANLIVSDIISSHNNIFIPIPSDTISPNDSMYINIVFTGDTIQDYLDSFTIYTNIGDTTICFEASVIGNPIISVDENIIIDTVQSCSDSLSYPVTIYNSGNEILNWTIYDNLIFNDFNDSATVSGLFTNGQISDTCSMTNSKVLFLTNNSYLSIGNMNILNGAKIDFDLKIGGGPNLCLNNESGNSIMLQYSKNNGPWVVLEEFDGNDFNEFVHISLKVPNIALSTQTRFRIIDLSVSSNKYFAIDNFALFSDESDHFSINNGQTTTNDSILTNYEVYSSSLNSGNISEIKYLSSNDVDTAFIPIGIEIEVNSAPILTTNIDCINLNDLPKNISTINDSLVIKNDGCDDLIVYDILSTNPDIVVIQNSFTLVESASSTIFLDITPTTSGNFTDTIKLYTNADTISICINYEVEEVGTILVDFISLYSPFKVCDGDIQHQFYVYNTGLGILDWHATFPSSIVLTPDTASVLPGDSILVNMDINITTAGNISSFINFYTNNPLQVTYLRTFNYQVYNDPCAGFVFQINANCNGIISFNDNSSGNVLSRTWNFGDGISSNNTSPNHNYSTSGNYVVEYIACGIQFCDTATQTISVNFSNSVIPANCYPIAYSSNSYGITNVSLNTLNNTSNNNTPNDYEDFSCTDGTQILVDSLYYISVQTTAASQNVKTWIDYNNNGIFESTELILNNSISVNHSANFIAPINAVLNTDLRMRVISSSTLVLDACNNVSSGQIEDYYIRLLANPKPPVTSFSSSNIFNCNGEVFFTDQSTNNPTSWSWDFGDGNSSNSQNPSHQYNTEGTYLVTLTSTNIDGTDTYSENINIEFFEVEFVSTGTNLINSNIDFTIINNYSTSVDWDWNFGDSNSSSLENPSHQYTTEGTYIVLLNAQNANGCTDTYQQSITITKLAVVDTPITSIKDISKEIFAELYPNPNDGNFVFSYKGNTKKLNLSVINSLGQIVFKENYNVKDKIDIEFNQNNLSKGIYYLQMTDDNYNKLFKFIIK